MLKMGWLPRLNHSRVQITSVKCHEVPGNPNLFLLPGHIELSEYETSLGIAQELSGSLLALKNLPGSIRFLLDRTSEAYQADYVIVDIEPKSRSAKSKFIDNL